MSRGWEPGVNRFLVFEHADGVSRVLRVDLASGRRVTVENRVAVRLQLLASGVRGPLVGRPGRNRDGRRPGNGALAPSLSPSCRLLWIHA